MQQHIKPEQLETFESQCGGSEQVLYVAPGALPLTTVSDGVQLPMAIR